MWLRFDEMRKLTLALATVRIPQPKKDGTIGKSIRSYRRCAKCQELKEPQDVHVDHVEPIGTPPRVGFSFSSPDWLAYLQRLGGANNLQVLCKACHVSKTRIDIQSI